MLKKILVAVLICASEALLAQSLQSIHTETTPSYSQYFSWINNTNEGATENQTLINLDFFRWMHDTYGLKLDIYAFDAGAIDGKKFYGNMQSARFKRQFPNSFTKVNERAKSMGTRLGLWGGPDGFGDTPEDAKARTELMVSLCRDFNFQLFKMDAVCGQLRPEKYDAFENMMIKCRQYSPDLILLNHRLNLGKGTKQSTTFLLGGQETYIDALMANDTTAPHHRACALARHLPPNLTRLTEDHGVCISSSNDFWEDDLVLQAFNRNLILSPQLYGSPWLLRDADYPKMARIFNIARQYKNILPQAKRLPEAQFGIEAVARGNQNTRLLTLRNLNWELKTFTFSLKDVGLDANAKSVEVLQYHPVERYVGKFALNDKVSITVPSYRSCLVKVTTQLDDDLVVKGCDYEVVKDVTGQHVEINLLALPGEKANVSISGKLANYKQATLENKDATGLLKGKKITVSFEGEKLRTPFHRTLGDLLPVEVPSFARALYEATCFAADNNALEVRELTKVGPSKIPQVQAARNAFFEQATFVNRNLWDKYLFDGDRRTAFSVSMDWGDQRIHKGAFRLDLGEIRSLDSIVVRTFDYHSLQPLKNQEGQGIQVSTNLQTWQELTTIVDTFFTIDLRQASSLRYLQFAPAPLRLCEIEGYYKGQKVDRSRWRASNLFSTYNSYQMAAQKAWSKTITLTQIPNNSYLCIAFDGIHGVEGAYAGIKIGDEFLGCPDRSPSFVSNTWEVKVKAVNKNYTYYFPLNPAYAGKPIEIYGMAMSKKPEEQQFKPKVYISAYPVPYEQKKLVLK